MKNLLTSGLFLTIAIICITGAAKTTNPLLYIGGCVIAVPTLMVAYYFLERATK